MKRWLIRLPAVVVLAAVMGWFGLYLMFAGGPWFPALDEFWTRYVLVASVLLWSILSAALSRRSLAAWIRWGLASPLLGCLIVAPPASFAVVISHGHIAFPIGMTTGALTGLLFMKRPPAVSPIPRSGEATTSPERSALHHPD
jgi:hypothetical protein